MRHTDLYSGQHLQMATQRPYLLWDKRQNNFASLLRRTFRQFQCSQGKKIPLVCWKGANWNLLHKRIGYLAEPLREDRSWEVTLSPSVTDASPIPQLLGNDFQFPRVLCTWWNVTTTWLDGLRFPTLHFNALSDTRTLSVVSSNSLVACCHVRFLWSRFH